MKKANSFPWVPKPISHGRKQIIVTPFLPKESPETSKSFGFPQDFEKLADTSPLVCGNNVMIQCSAHVNSLKSGT